MSAPSIDVSRRLQIPLAALLYFSLVFAAGFMLGTLRIFLLIPRVGELAAVAIELPVMLLVGWIAAAVVIRWFGIPPALAARLRVGLIAFALLMAAELALTLFLFEKSAAEHVAAYRSASALLGLAGQIAFALFPAMLLLGRQRA